VRPAIGVDGGGTETIAVRAADGALGRGPSSNPTAIGIARAASAIAAVVRELADGACDVFVGAAGAGRPAIAQPLAAAIERELGSGSTVHVEGDSRIALRAAIPSGPGAIVRAGTGSFAYAENGERSVRVGGAGYLLGDEGSGFAIGIAALRLYARILEGRAHDDAFAARMAAATGTDGREELLGFTYGDGPRVSEVASVAGAVLDLAGSGHRGATRIVQQASADLAELVRAAVVQAGLLESEPAVALGGGILRTNSLLTYLLETRLAAEIPGASIVRSDDAAGPARAAARLAEGLPAPV
jgi:N-acetylglucosamine kinase-like BadF-type ATPase